MLIPPLVSAFVATELLFLVSWILDSKSYSEILFNDAGYKKINLTMEDLDKVTGGEIGQLSAEMLLRSIPIFKQNGKTLEEFLEEVRRRGWSEEIIEFCIANW